MAIGTGTVTTRPRTLSRSSTAVRDLHPGYFVFVMATGIISTGAFALGPSWLSRLLLVVASIGFAVLSAALVMRLTRFRSSVAADVHAPERVFGFFTTVAAIDVLGVRLGEAGHPMATAVLAALAAAVWLVMTYGVPASLLLTRQRDSALGGVNGTWLIWVVGTQSLSVAASALIAVWPSQSGLLAPVAVGLWSVGLVLYLMLVSMIMMRWLTVPMTPATLGPPYWILMGATAITVPRGCSDPEPSGCPTGTPRDCRCRGGILVRPLGVRHLVDPVARRAWSLAPCPAPLAAHLRAHPVERGLSPRHVQRCHAVVRQGGPSQLHGAHRPVHALGRRRSLGGGGCRLCRSARPSPK